MPERCTHSPLALAPSSQSLSALSEDPAECIPFANTLGVVRPQPAFNHALLSHLLCTKKSRSLISLYYRL